MQLIFVNVQCTLLKFDEKLRNRAMSERNEKGQESRRSELVVIKDIRFQIRTE